MAAGAVVTAIVVGVSAAAVAFLPGRLVATPSRARPAVAHTAPAPAGPPTVVVASVVDVRPATGRACGIRFEYRVLRDQPPDHRFRWHVDNYTSRPLYASVDYDGQVVAGPMLASPGADLDITIDSGSTYSLLVTDDQAANDQLCIQLAAAPTGTDHVGWSN